MFQKGTFPPNKAAKRYVCPHQLFTPHFPHFCPPTFLDLSPQFVPPPVPPHPKNAPFLPLSPSPDTTPRHPENVPQITTNHRPNHPQKPPFRLPSRHEKREPQKLPYHHSLKSPLKVPQNPILSPSELRSNRILTTIATPTRNERSLLNHSTFRHHSPIAAQSSMQQVTLAHTHLLSRQHAVNGGDRGEIEVLQPLMVAHQQVYMYHFSHLLLIFS